MPATTSSPTELSPAELAAWRGFLRAQAELMRELDADLDREHALPLSSYEVLLHLARAPEGRLRMSELADSVLLSRSGVTRLVDRLEDQRLVERSTCKADARGLNAAITTSGRAKLRAARRTHLAGVRERFTDRFGDRELEQLAEFWERVLPGASA